MVNDDTLMQVGYSILNIVQSIQVTLDDEPRYGDIYIGLNAEHLREVAEDLLSIQKRIEKMRRELPKLERNENNASNH